MSDVAVILLAIFVLNIYVVIQITQAFNKLIVLQEEHIKIMKRMESE